MALDYENPLVLPLVRGAATSYTYFPNDKIKQFPLGVGTNTVLVSALQVRLCLVMQMQHLLLGLLDCLVIAESDKLIVLPNLPWVGDGEGTV